MSAPVSVQGEFIWAASRLLTGEKAETALNRLWATLLNKPGIIARCVWCHDFHTKGDCYGPQAKI